MKVPGKIQLTVWLFGFAGAALFIAIVIHQDLSKVGAAFATAGWAIVGIVAYHFLVPVFLDAIAWWVLFPRPDRLPLRKLLWMRWIGESVSTLVPSAAVGGDIVVGCYQSESTGKCELLVICKASPRDDHHPVVDK